MGHHLRCFIYLNDPEGINQIQLDKFNLEQFYSISYPYIQFHNLKQWFLIQFSSVLLIKIDPARTTTDD